MFYKDKLIMDFYYRMALMLFNYIYNEKLKKKKKTLDAIKFIHTTQTLTSVAHTNRETSVSTYKSRGDNCDVGINHVLTDFFSSLQIFETFFF